MKTYLVMTSINAPTEAVRSYAQMEGLERVMIGDRKTPTDWEYDGFTYLSPRKQEKLRYKLAGLLPWNRPARINIAYLYALERGAEFIIQADDDNIPNGYWHTPVLTRNELMVDAEGFVNIYRHFSNKFIWPRGYPLNRILRNESFMESREECNVRVWQHLADNDTDVDAIYRLTINETMEFKQRKYLALKEGTVCPFNCQSTTYHREAAPLLYLPSLVTPRASDIVRGLVAQPILWSFGMNLAFTSPTVRQERNPHDYMVDFKDEMLIYLSAETIFDLVLGVVSKELSMYENLYMAYSELVKHGLVPEEELHLVESWNDDVAALTAESN